ncbi:MAG: sulfur oxidation c-type cytochrome SoxX [Halieaceae bacterium]|jgi:sulfur-oxidizing protein SoxX|nr:sulfur oxidation c-type cytochrome SoxX [Halieaceae bacterium]
MARLVVLALLLSSRLALAADTLPPLVQLAASPAEGKRIFLQREAGHCVLCHQVAGLDAPFQGNLGPDLTGVGSRLTAAQIRLRIVDASRLNPDTIMPPYYRREGLEQVAEAYRGRTVLSAEQIEHLVAWLASLEQADGE